MDIPTSVLWNKRRIPIKYSGTTPNLRPSPRPSLLAIDTETELITSKAYSPPIVLFQIYNGVEIQLVNWTHLGPYLEELRSVINGDCKVLMHNASFDVSVLQSFQKEVYKQSSCLPDMWDTLLDYDKLYDTGLLAQLIDLATTGMPNEKYPSLKQLSLRAIGYDMSKDQDVRLTFKRSYDPSPRHLLYAAIDALVTFDIGRALIPKYEETTKTLGLQTRAMVSLNAISREGMPVDREHLRKEAYKHTGVFNDAKESLSMMGVIMNDKDLPSTSKECLRPLLEEEEVLDKISRSVTKLLYVAPSILKGEDLPDLGIKKIPESTSEMTSHVFRLTGIEEEPQEDGTHKSLSLKQLSYLLWYFHKELEKGECLGRARIQAGQTYILNGGWKTTREGPDASVQRLLAQAEKDLNTRFPRTGTGKISTDETALYLLPTDHPFLNAYKSYKTEEKLLSTYLTDKYIQEDGRVHPRFNVLMRTGRTSCSSPNLQNPPKLVGIREMYVPPPGFNLLAADYAQLELCALAHDCYKRQGESVMRDVINAGVDIHSWVALRLLKIPSLPDLNTPSSRKALISIIENKAEGYTDPEKFGYLRTCSKAANFGFPGGLGAPTFIGYAAGYGVTLSEEEAFNLKEVWLSSFPEMDRHLQPEVSNMSRNGFMATTLTGRVREDATFCAAANCRFQGLSADGCKKAMWELYKRRYPVCNFIHDEFLVFVPEGRRQRRIQAQAISRIMVEEMAKLLYSVRIKVDWEITRKWTKDKNARVLAKGSEVCGPLSP